ncbi:hypothetical protein BAUCODRAFT_29140 [Baudoinia panamericana UAMH 10762]|uniref:Uncharacterized protein n=1 Tax=Baudoinia panamericana (strain UAMH 10762) TaxID=717646 RepID=M2NML9_BAUPA|nr:uncharacterized protein BAUCODRAFT_29140 [Baudoinia panamericana UAMH 10762]EMD00775.1 hypothetical protein BAUCODRAFT_29140 [Baudoinia panamericana UAMH 10762]
MGAVLAHFVMFGSLVVMVSAFARQEALLFLRSLNGLCEKQHIRLLLGKLNHYTPMLLLVRFLAGDHFKQDLFTDIASY